MTDVALGTIARGAGSFEQLRDVALVGLEDYTPPLSVFLYIHKWVSCRDLSGVVRGMKASRIPENGLVLVADSSPGEALSVGV